MLFGFLIPLFLVIVNVVALGITWWNLYQSTSDADIDWSLWWSKRLLSLVVILNTIGLFGYLFLELRERITFN